MACKRDSSEEMANSDEDNWTGLSPSINPDPTYSSTSDREKIWLRIDDKVVDVKDSKYKLVQARMSDEDECIDDRIDEEQTRPKVRVPKKSSLDLELHLRDYQKELAAPALHGLNTIICCQTGSGKTRVALDIIIKHLRIGRGVGRKTNKVCFLVRTVPLAIQQYKAICTFLPKEYKIRIFTGYSPDNMMMPQLLGDLDIVVITPMILLNHINWGNLKNTSIFSLLVFDECHHTREGEPYNSLMFTYMDQKFKGETNLPQIVGLTASIPMEGAFTLDTAEESILQLCANLDVTTISIVVKYREQLESTVPKPTERFVKLQLSDQDESFQSIVRVMNILQDEAQRYANDILEANISEKISEIANKKPENKKHQSYMNWVVDLYNEASKIPRRPEETCLPVRSLMVIAEYLKKYHVASELHDLVHVREVVNYLDLSFAENKNLEATTRDEQRFYEYFIGIQDCLKRYFDRENQNLLHLMTVLEEHLLQKGPSSRGIIFVKTRAIAEGLVSWLKRCPNKEIQLLKASIFTGTNAKDIHGGMTQVEQNDILKKFKEGKIRILVATSVAEEGIDVRECNLVVKYNYIGNETTLIQTRGRCREKGGFSVLMGLPGSEIFEKEMINIKRASLMEQGINKMREWERHDIQKKITEIQQKDAETRRLQKLEDDKKSKEKNKGFKMFCKLCRNFCVESKDVRLLLGNYRVLVNKSVLRGNKIFSIKPHTIDDVKFVGSVKCTTIVENGRECNGPLGAYILYKRVKYLALGIKNFMIEEEGQTTLKSYKKWRQVPYPVMTLLRADVLRYVNEGRSMPSENEGTGRVGASHRQPLDENMDLDIYSDMGSSESSGSPSLSFSEFPDLDGQLGTGSSFDYDSDPEQHQTYKKLYL